MKIFFMTVQMESINLLMTLCESDGCFILSDEKNE